MSAIAIATRAILGSPTLVAIVGQNVWPIEADQGAAPPWILLNLVSDPDDELLAGAARFRDSRITIECVHPEKRGVVELGEAVVDALRDIHLATFGSWTASFFKEGTDVTDSSADRATFRRIIDYHVRWR